MQRIRSFLSILIFCGLAAGYAASQWAFFQGTWAEHARAVDTPAMRNAALVALLVCIASAFVPERPEESDS